MSDLPGPRLRRTAETAACLLVIGVAAVAVAWAAARLRVVVLPVLLAIILATFLEPPARWLRRRGWPDGLAALAVLGVTLAVVAAAFAALAPVAVDDFRELDVSLDSAVDEVRGWVDDGAVGLSGDQVSNAIDRIRDQVRDNAGAISRGALTGAVILVEVLVGLLLAIVLLFFVLKDGERIWRWVYELAPPQRRGHVRELGERSWAALAGFLRGQTIVALFDAALIGLALVLVGVPLVLPLVVITFIGAYIPIVGATVAGLAAVAVALASEGPTAALVVLAAIVAVQQLEGNVLEPVVVGRTVDVHPVAILLGVTAGAVLAGVIGAMVAAPAVAVAAAVLRYARELGEQPPAVAVPPAS